MVSFAMIRRKSDSRGRGELGLARLVNLFVKLPLPKHFGAAGFSEICNEMRGFSQRIGEPAFAPSGLRRREGFRKYVAKCAPFAIHWWPAFA